MMIVSEIKLVRLSKAKLKMTRAAIILVTKNFPLKYLDITLNHLLEKMKQINYGYRRI